MTKATFTVGRLAAVLAYLNTDHPLTCCYDRSPDKLAICENDVLAVSRCERRKRRMQVCSNLCRHEGARRWCFLVQTWKHSRGAQCIFVSHPIAALLAKTCILLAGHPWHPRLCMYTHFSCARDTRAVDHLAYVKDYSWYLFASCFLRLFPTS